MRVLITGGCGFLGSNLSMGALRRGHDLVIFDNLSRTGSDINLQYLKAKNTNSFTFVHGDIRNTNDVDQLLAAQWPDAIFHLAGQVAMTTSISDPRKDFEINALGTLNVLEAMRKNKSQARLIYSSTNKVYGDLEHLKYIETNTRYIASDFPRGFTEDLPLQFMSPYGCSKGCADQYILDYAKIHGLRSIVFRHSSIFGERQFATEDQGWIGWFIAKALQQKRQSVSMFSISGEGKQVRDVLFSADLEQLYFSALDKMDRASVVGQAFNIGGGIENSISLLELFDFLERRLDIKLKYEKLKPRQSDQKVFVADISKAMKLLDWKPETARDSAIERMIDWVRDHAT